MERINHISIEELNERIRGSERFTLLDVREAAVFTQKHIPGAMNIPVRDVERRAYKELPRDEEVIVYGDSKHSADAIDAVKTLERLGYRATLAEGGREAWEKNEWSFTGESIGPII